MSQLISYRMFKVMKEHANEQDYLQGDEAARVAALDVSRSFLMQAPAGSGKTEVLTQRFLALLTQVEQPEQILALTFTNKAAAQMRYRVVQALRLAQGPAPTAEPALSRWRLASAVLARDEQKDWHLTACPHRLRLYTIDSLCATLVKQSPLAVPFAGFAIAPDARPLYQEAVSTVLYAVDKPWLDSLRRLLLYFNTDYQYFQTLLVGMLANRDAWFADAQVMVQGLTEQRFSAGSVVQLFEQQLSRLQAFFKQQLVQSFAFWAHWDELWRLVLFAQQQLLATDPTNSSIKASDDIIDSLADLAAAPPEMLEIAHWQLLASSLCTQAGDLRRSLNKNNGFPPAAKQEKQAMLAILEQLASAPFWPVVQVYLALVLKTPQRYLTEVDTGSEASPAETPWPLVLDVMHLGVAAVQQLEQVFRRERLVDYVGLAQGALLALGSEELDPSEVLLRFDYRIEHLLMDEFQDTSHSQIMLFQRLTAGWQPDDGRSLFFVGDPMQSIYGFRKADVNVFYAIKQRGLGERQLTFLQLRQNFRSRPALVQTLQQLLAPVFPAVEDPLLQQVTFSKAVAAKGKLESDADGPVVPPLLASILPSRAEEVQWLVTQLQQVLAQRAAARQLDPNHSAGTIAILVRKKKQVPAITQALRQAQIPYTAVELDPVWDFTSVQDLYHLAGVMFDIPQAYHWLAVCRAPWLGFGLAELQALARYWPGDPGLVQLTAQTPIDGLSAGSFARLLAFTKALRRLQQASALTLVERLRGLYFAMLGPEIYVADSAPLDEFWRVFGSLVVDDRIDMSLLQQQLQSSFASVVQPDAQVEIMTIHKSKGLEFQTVFVPGLEDMKGRSNPNIVDMLSFQCEPDEPLQTLFAVRSSADKLQQEPTKDGPTVVNLLLELQGHREAQEMARLFYVAATRAEQQLFLSATLKPNSKGVQQPAANSLLSKIISFFTFEQSQQVEQDTFSIAPFEALAPEVVSEAVAASSWHQWQPSVPAVVHESQQGSYWPRQTGLAQSHRAAQRLGQLVHLWLASATLADLERQQSWVVWCENAMQSFGWREATSVLAETAARLIASMQGQSRVQWLLQPRAVVFREQDWQMRRFGQVQTLRPDLVFQEADGCLWIVDFKTVETGMVQDTLAIAQSQAVIQEEYGSQLEGYAQVFFAAGYRAIRLAVFMPGVDGCGWWEWAAGVGSVRA